MKKTSALLLTLSLLGILFAANLLASRFWWRADLTEDRRYSLAPATKDLLKNLDDVLTIRAYVSSGLPSGFSPILFQLEDTLDELKTFGGKKVQIEYIDPLRSQVEEQKAQLLGIPPLQIGINANNQQSVMRAYLGLAFFFADRRESIPYLTYQTNLEYEIAQAVLKVSREQVPALGWYEGDTHEELFGGGFDDAKRLLSERYSVQNIPLLDQKSLTGLAALVIATPGKMAEQELFELDQFLMHGGHVLVLADHWQVTKNMALKEKSSPLFAQLAHYGVTINPNVLLDRSHVDAPFSSGMQVMAMPYPAWILVQGRAFAEHPAVASLEALTLPWSSSLELASSSTEVKTTVLASSTAEAVALMMQNNQPPSIDRDELLKQYEQSEKKQFPLAAELSGEIPSAYGEQGLKSQVRGDFLKKSNANARLVVVGTARIAQNGYTQLFPYDLAFVENMVDSLTWGEALNGIRTRSYAFRPLYALHPDAISGFKFFNIVFGPVLVLFLALVLWFIRRRKNSRLQREFAA